MSENEQTYINLATTETNNKNYQLARQYYEMAIDINPNNDKAYMGLGGIHHELNDYQDALNSFIKAVELNNYWLHYLHQIDSSEFLDYQSWLEQIKGQNISRQYDYFIQLITSPNLNIQEIDLEKIFWQGLGDYESEVFSVLGRENALTKIIQDIDVSNKIVGDFGCGTGNLIQHLSNYNKIVACDFSNNMLNIAKLSIVNKKIDFKQIDFKTQALTPVDVAFSINSFFPKNDKEADRWMGNIKQSIKPNGIFIITVLSFISLISRLKIKNKFDANQNAFINLHGYINQHNRIVKHWLEDEIKEFIAKYFYIIDFKQVKLDCNCGDKNCTRVLLLLICKKI